MDIENLRLLLRSAMDFNEAALWATRADTQTCLALKPAFPRNISTLPAESVQDCLRAHDHHAGKLIEKLGGREEAARRLQMEWSAPQYAFDFAFNGARNLALLYAYAPEPTPKP